MRSASEHLDVHLTLETVQRLGVAVPGTTPPNLYAGAGGRRSPASARFADAASVGLDMQALDDEHPVAGAVGRGVDSG
jgi:hypothetical protein